ncbi:globin domain-containing protein, partial [Vreelandella neptunia]|uniref:globin domain-containing protein n=1 Tax=Vreelandella neptunia TaxID=115551 RepID=UPI0030ED11CC|nr:hypothetical protein [Halomonas neptunia]
GDLVATIVNKHVALQIRAEHYPLVGASLLQAIREVLGEEVASDAVIDAWGAAYGQLADILAGEEGRIYKAQAAAPGGWSGARASPWTADRPMGARGPEERPRRPPRPSVARGALASDEDRVS